MRRIISAILLAVVAFLPLRTGFTRGESETKVCAALVRTALDMTQQFCEGTGRNQACYGNVRVDASPRPETNGMVFEERGDTVAVADVQSIRTSPMDLGSGEWGVALMRLQAALTSSTPGNITLILMGNTTLEPVLDPSRELPTLEASVNTWAFRIPVRQLPSTSSPAIATLSAGSQVVANGRLADGKWVRVELPDGTGLGWVLAPLLSSARPFDRLDVVDARASSAGPMHAFYFTSGAQDSGCPEAPESGMLIQTPEGVAEVTLLINEVDIQLGSTVYVQAVPDQRLGIYVVEGHANVSSGGVVEHVPAGGFTSVPLSQDLSPAGPPQDAKPYEKASVASLPVPLLERPIEIEAPTDDGDEDVGMIVPQSNRPEGYAAENRPTGTPLATATPLHDLTYTPTLDPLGILTTTPASGLLGDATPVPEWPFDLPTPTSSGAEVPLQPTPEGDPVATLPTQYPFDVTPPLPSPSAAVDTSSPYVGPTAVPTVTATRVPPGLQSQPPGNPARPRPLRPVERSCAELLGCATSTPLAQVDVVLVESETTFGP